MRLVLLGTAQDLAVLGVLDVVLDLDHDGLVHLVADHVAFPALAVTPGRRGAVCRGSAGGSLAHCLSPARLRAALRQPLPSSLVPRSSVQAPPRPFGSLTCQPPRLLRPRPSHRRQRRPPPAPRPRARRNPRSG